MYGNSFRFNVVVRLVAATAFAFVAGIIAAESVWTPTAVLNSHAFVDNVSSDDTRPEIATDGKGNRLSLWRQTAPEEGLWVAHSAGGAWGTAVKLPAVFAENADVWDTELAYVGGNIWISAWATLVREVNGPGSVMASRSSNNGQTWSVPVKMDSGGASVPAHRLKDTVDIAADGTGNVVMTWMEDDGFIPGTNSYGLQRALIVRSADYGLNWSSPEEVTVTAGKDLGRDGTRISYAGGGKYVMSYDLRTTRSAFSSEAQWATVHVATSVDQGVTWTEIGSILGAITSRDTSVVGDVSAAGNKIVLAALVRNVLISETSTDNGLLIYSSTDDGSTFTAPIKASRIGYAVDLSDDSFPTKISIANNTSGTWMLMADDVEDSLNNNRLVPTIRAWRSTDPATTWTEELVPQVQSTQRSYPSVAVDKDGKFTSVFQSRDSSAPVHLRDFDIQNVNFAGDDGPWAFNGFVNHLAATDYSAVTDRSPHIAAGDGTMLACWLAETPGPETNEILISRSEDDGHTWSPAKPLFGPLVAGNSLGQPQMHYTGNGSWSAFWGVGTGYTTLPNYMVSHSTDDGVTWSNPIKGSMEAYGDNNVFAGNHAGTFLTKKPGNETPFEISRDGGVTWVAAGEFPHEVSYIAHAGGTNWLAVAGSEYGGSRWDFHSSNDGATWTQLHGPDRPSATGWMTGIQSDHNGTVVATGSRLVTEAGGIYTLETYARVSKDFGVSWSPAILIHVQTETNLDPVVSYTVNSKPVWIKGNRWGLIMPHVMASRIMYLDFNRIKSVKLFAAASRDGGSTWDNPVVTDELGSLGQVSHPVFTYAGSGYGVVAGTQSVLNNSMNLGLDGDIVYRIFKQSRPPAAAGDWQLYQ